MMRVAQTEWSSKNRITWDFCLNILVVSSSSILPLKFDYETKIFKNENRNIIYLIIKILSFDKFKIKMPKYKILKTLTTIMSITRISFTLALRENSSRS